MHVLARNEGEILFFLDRKAGRRRTEVVNAGLELNDAVTSFVVSHRCARRARAHEHRFDRRTGNHSAILIEDASGERDAIKILRGD